MNTRESKVNSNMSLKKIRDRWSFLAEIEAPMWVDLALESENYNQDASEEDWFNTTHQFHQCSSRHLKSTIFHPREGTVASGFDLQSPFSPKLPSSVSRSRGKDYRGKNLESHNPHRRQSKEDLGKKSLFSEQGNQEEMRPRSSMRQSKGSSILSAILDREGGSYHPLKAVATSKSSTTNSVYSSTSTSNSRTSNAASEKNQLQQQKSHSLKPAATFKSSAASRVMSSRPVKNSISSSIHFEKNHPQQQSSHPLKSAPIIQISASIGVNSASPNDSGTSTNIADNNLPNPQEEQDISSRLCDSSTSSGNSGTSNITFESTQPQQQMPLHISSQVFGNASERLAILRSSFRKSCVIRQASRLELQSDAAQTRGSGSSSRKCNVSSSNPNRDVSLSRLMETRCNGSTTPESRYTVRNERTTKSLIIFSDAPKKPVTSIEERKANSSNRGGTNYAKPAGATVTKSKGQLKTTHARALQPLREKKQQSSLSSTENKGSTRPSKLKTSTIGKENAIGKPAISTICKGKSNTNAHMSCGQKGKDQRILADSKAKLDAQNDGRAYKDGTQKAARFESCRTKKSIPR